MASPAPSKGPASSSRHTALWQLVLVALSLGAFALLVLLPVGLLLVTVVTAYGLHKIAGGLDQLGILTQGRFEGAMTLALVLLGLGAGVSLLLMGWSLILRMSESPRKPPFLLRSPVFSFFVLLALASWFSLPTHGHEASLPVLSGGLLLALVAWPVFAAIELFGALCLGGLVLSWRIARASPFGAGLLTVAGAGGTVFFLLLCLGIVVEAVESQQKSLPRPRSIPACEHSLSAECVRQILVLEAGQEGAAAPARRQTALRDAGSATDGFQASRALDEGSLDTTESARSRRTRECLETRYRDTSLLEAARRLAAKIAGSANAWDIVHATLLSVCLRANEPLDFRMFFLTSVHNGASNWRVRASMWTCSLEDDPEPTDCGMLPDESAMRGETLRALQAALCSLGKSDQEVLFLRYFMDLEDREVASRLGIDSAAVRKRLQRARERLGDDFLQRCR